MNVRLPSAVPATAMMAMKNKVTMERVSERKGFVLRMSFHLTGEDFSCAPAHGAKSRAASLRRTGMSQDAATPGRCQAGISVLSFPFARKPSPAAPSSQPQVALAEPGPQRNY